VHELVLANGIVDAVINFAAENKSKVVEFKVAVGELASINIELMRRLLEEIVKKTILEKAKIIVEVEKARIRCQLCNYACNASAYLDKLTEDEKEIIHFVPELLSTFARCPRCGSCSFNIESGRSVRVVEVKLEEQ